MSASSAHKWRPPSTMEERKPETAHDQVREYWGAFNLDWKHEGRAIHGWIFDDTPNIRLHSGLPTNPDFAEDQFKSSESSIYVYSFAGDAQVCDRAEWKDTLIQRIGGSWRHWPDIDEVTAEWAKKFVNALPDDIDEPEVDPTPQGEIDFSWDNDDVTFGVLVLRSGDLGMAGVFNKMKLHGNASWKDKEVLPGFVMSGLRWVHGKDL